MLLAVCDADGQFTYIRAGSPGMVRDAGLWARSDLQKLIEQGLLEVAASELEAGGEERNVYPFLVGDSAFALSPCMMRIPDVPVNAHGAEADAKRAFDRRVMNARQLIEQAFGQVELLRRQHVLAVSRAVHAVAVCTGPHNFFESRHVVYDETLDAAAEALQMQVVEQNGGVGVVGMAPQQPTTAVRTALGEFLREFLVQWVQENCLRACALRLRTLAIAHGAKSSSSSSSSIPTALARQSTSLPASALSLAICSCTRRLAILSTLASSA